MPPMAPPIFCFRFSPAGFHFFRRFILNETVPNDSPIIFSDASLREPAAFTEPPVKLAGTIFTALGAGQIDRGKGSAPSVAINPDRKSGMVHPTWGTSGGYCGWTARRTNFKAIKSPKRPVDLK